MDINDDEEIVMTHEEHSDVRISNNLDLNVEQDCRSPKSSNANGLPSNGSSKYEQLRLSMEFESDEQAYRFYNKYAELAGFSVRKDWVNRSKVHGRVMSRKFTCSRQGHRKKDKRDANVKKHRKETRTGCLAHMVVTRQPNGKYLVTQFEAKHNHGDVDLEKAEKLLESLLSENTVSNQGSGSESTKNSEIQSTLSLQLLGIRFCPPDNFDDLQMDEEIFLGCGRTRDMKEGDAARLMCYFQRQHFMNPSFFYSVQLDIDDKVSNIFWADDNTIVDYGHFGDVVCLDTSCMRKTNFRPYLQLVGLNNHRQVVIFGAAFLYNDSVDSIKWLLRTFIEGMSGKKPKFILSDQDATVVQAIHAVLPEVNHCMCAWQVYLIALKHLHHVVKEYDSFAADFRNCVFSHEQEEDFTRAWDLMLEKHGLRNNAWLKWMLREKEKWAVAYGRNTFFVERDNTHLVELLSDKLRSYLGLDIDVLHFFKHFKSVVNEQRYKELELALDTGKHPILMTNAIFLKPPSEIYTPNAFGVFQREYEKCLNVVINQCGERDSRIDYKAKTYGKTRDFSVVFNSHDATVSCNCMKFEHVGFLCCHALKVLDHQNIKVVPSYYILKRWTKEARVSPAVENSDYTQEDDNKSIIASRYRDLCRNIIKLSARAAGSDPAFEYASRQLNEVMQGIERILNFKSFDSGKGTCSASDELADDDNIRTEYDCEVDADVLKGSAVTEGMVRNKDKLNQSDEQFPHSSGGLSVRQSPVETVLHVACPPTTYISSPSPTPSLSPLAQGLYTIEANHIVQGMYQASSLTINQQPNPNMYEHSSFYTNQNHSPGHAQFLQDSLIRNQFQDPMPNSTQLKPVMGGSRHPASFMNYNHRYRAAGV